MGRLAAGASEEEGADGKLRERWRFSPWNLDAEHPLQTSRRKGLNNVHCLHCQVKREVAFWEEDGLEAGAEGAGAVAGFEVGASAVQKEHLGCEASFFVVHSWQVHFDPI